MSHRKDHGQIRSWLVCYTMSGGRRISSPSFRPGELDLPQAPRGAGCRTRKAGPTARLRPSSLLLTEGLCSWWRNVCAPRPLQTQAAAASSRRDKISPVQSRSRVRLFVTPLDCRTPGLPVHHQLPELAQTHAHRVDDAIQPSHPLSSPYPPAFNSSQRRVLFQRVGSSHQVAKCWSFSFSISPSNEYSGLISFRMDWLDLLAVPGTLKSLLQHHSWKASFLWHSAFFIVQLSHPYMTTGETIAWTRRTFVGKVMSLLF